MRKQHIRLLLVLLLAASSALAENTWDKREAIGGSKRERGVGFVIGNRGYVGLGQDTLDLMMTDLWEYDPGTNSWTQKANFPGVGRRDAIAFSIGLKGYVGTGMDNPEAAPGNVLSDFYEYSPVTNTWTPRAPYPGSPSGGIYYATGFSLLGKGYLCCGKEGASTYSNELWEFNPATNSWLQKASFPFPGRYGCVAFVLNNFAYVGTGTDENVFTSEFAKYNPVTNTWTVIADFPGSERFSCSSFTLDGNGYILFGSDGGYKDECWMYDPNDNFWYEKASFPGGARRSAIAFTINDRAYAGSGKGLTGVRRDFWEYSPFNPLGIGEQEELISSVFPNPFTERATVILSEKISGQFPDLSYYLMNMRGQAVSSAKIQGAAFCLERNQLASGTYLLNVYSGQRCISSKKLIIQ